MSKPQPKKIVRINENALVDLIDNKIGDALLIHHSIPQF